MFELLGPAPLSHTGPRRREVSAILTFIYDREADILHIDQCPPYPAQEAEELDDNVIARLNPTTREVENLELLYFSRRLLPQPAP